MSAGTKKKQFGERMSQKDCEKRWRNSAGGRRYGLKVNAKRRNIPFDLLIEDFEDLTNQPICYYCGRELNMINKLALDGFTIDRLDNTYGYTVENLVSSCRRCNIIKGSWFTPEQMLDIAENYLDLE